MNEASEARFYNVQLQTLIENILSGQLNIHSILIERQGQIIAERYRRGKDKSVYSLFARNIDFGPTVLHDTRSVGKSILSLLLGIAKGQGNRISLNDPVMEYYPEHVDLAAEKVKAITLEHLLTMSSGLQWSEGDGFPDDEHHLYWKKSPSRFVLSRAAIDSPGERFNYNSGGTALLSDILTRITKTSLKDFVHTFLFEPLDIHPWKWVADLHGRPMAFTGLRMSPPDMIKIGRLVLNKGMWNGRQIVPADWITASLQPRVQTGFDELMYGYHWWAGNVGWQGKQISWAGAFGNGGQRIYVIPQLDMTIVITAGAYGNAQAPRSIHQFFKDIISTVE